jgi:hypothetical protein
MNQERRITFRINGRLTHSGHHRKCELEVAAAPKALAQQGHSHGFHPFIGLPLHGQRFQSSRHTLLTLPVQTKCKRLMTKAK